ncbi:MAG TPA: hypothetical protein VL242_42800 [Sorangium sp.]|nr:hypothetical protein [Sorangium sp.]
MLARWHAGTLARWHLFHSIVGLHENTTPTDACVPDADVVESTCGTAVAPGTGYQALSKKTGGLRFPLLRFERRAGNKG